jgi:hypothetical protein
LFILDGGYRKYFEMHPEDCEGGYVPMQDEAYASSGDMARETSSWKRMVRKWQRKRQTGVVRANTLGCIPVTRCKSEPECCSDLSPLPTRRITFESPMAERKLDFASPLSGVTENCWNSPVSRRLLFDSPVCNNDRKIADTTAPWIGADEW